MTLFAICLHSHSVSQLSASPTSRFNGTSKALLKPAGISCPLQPCRSSLEFWEQCMGTENSSKWAFLHLSFLCYIIQGMEVESDGQQPGKKIVRKPYVVNGQCCIWGSPKPLFVILSSCAVPGCYFLSRLVEERVFSKCLSLQPQEGSCHCEMCWCVGPE